MQQLSDYLQARGHGSKRELAQQIQAHQSDISDWVSGKRVVPFHRCVAIERATKGAVCADGLNKSAPWTRIVDPDWPHPDGRPTLDFARESAHG